jgi:hypothetical protein
VFHFGEFPVAFRIGLALRVLGLGLAFSGACGVRRFSPGEIRCLELAPGSSRNLRASNIGRRGSFSVGLPEGTSDPPRLARMIAG